MILQTNIQALIENNQDKNPLYLRNLIKEELQNYILNFVFTQSNYQDFIFTGGTCLRKIYGLNRLSEDLDFDLVESGFQIDQFAEAVRLYFKQTLLYPNLRVKIAPNQNSVYFKFPLLKELNLVSAGTPEDIFVRTDFSKDEVGFVQTEKQLISAGSFLFFVTAYDLPTMFANKIVAFLTRVFYKDQAQPLPFKGRDVYDLYWLTQVSVRTGFKLKVNQDRLEALLNQANLITTKQPIAELVLAKIDKLDKKSLAKDLSPMIASETLLNDFLDSYQNYLKRNLPMVIG